MRPVTLALTTGWALSRRAAVSRFDEASRAPREAQARWLRGALERVGPSAYGRAHRLDDVADVETFRRRAPVTSWAEVAPWVERIERGEANVLSTEPVLMLERTSGSSATPKRVPYTKGLLADFGAATSPWLDDLFRHFPSLSTTRQYWSLSPVSRAPERTSGGLRIGMEDDTEYFDPLTRAAMKRLFVVPGAVARCRSLEAWREETLVHLLNGADLGFVSVWNPSFLAVLFDGISGLAPTLEPRLTPARRHTFARALEGGRFDAETMWPSLALISCWTEGWAAQALPELRRFFPSTPVQGKGLLATEGVVSFPLWGEPGAVAAVTSHFLEFEALDDEGRPLRLVDELRDGARYAPIITTRGGLVRYRLPDVVRCVGWWRAVPLLRFEGRLDKTADLRGEKLSAVVVERAIAEVVRAVPVAFVLLAPSLAPARYRLFVEGVPQATADQLARSLEAALLGEHHYRYCRELGQLGAIEAVTVTDGRVRYLEALRARGLKLGDIKPSAFDVRPEWDAVFEAARVLGR